MYANAGECGDFLTEAFSGSTKVYSSSYGEFCGDSAGKWTTVGNIPLDGSDYPGGITRVWVDNRVKTAWLPGNAATTTRGSCLCGVISYRRRSGDEVLSACTAAIRRTPSLGASTDP